MVSLNNHSHRRSTVTRMDFVFLTPLLIAASADTLAVTVHQEASPSTWKRPPGAHTVFWARPFTQESCAVLLPSCIGWDGARSSPTSRGRCPFPHRRWQVPGRGQTRSSGAFLRETQGNSPANGLHASLAHLWRCSSAVCWPSGGIFTLPPAGRAMW